MTESPLPWLDLDTTRRKAEKIRQERIAATKAYEAAVKKAAESKRAHRQAESIALVKNLKEFGATAALRKARLDCAQQEFQAELDEGMVGVAKERLEQAKEDLWSALAPLLRAQRLQSSAGAEGRRPDERSRRRLLR